MLDDGRLRRPARSGVVIVQTAQPRDIGALLLVLGVFLVLFVLSVAIGSPIR